LETKNNILDQIELRSEQVQEVLETPPNWLIRWGSLMILSVIALFFLLACIIKYPEFISSTLVITSQNPAEKIEVRINTRIEKIMVRDHQEVKKDQLLLVLESTAKYTDMLQLKRYIDSFSTQDLSKFPLQVVARFNLGEVQEDYNILAKALQDELLFQEILLLEIFETLLVIGNTFNSCYFFCSIRFQLLE